MTDRKLSVNKNVTFYELTRHPKRRKRLYTKVDMLEPVCMCCGYPETIERLMK